MATGSARSARVMSYIYLGAAVQLLLILSALRVTAVQALQATQSKQTSDALRRARARRASTARGNFVDLVSARSSLFDVAASIAEEENTVAPAFAKACVDDLSKLAAARLSLTSALGDGGNKYEGEAGRVAAAVAATLGDWRVDAESTPDEPFLVDAVVARDAGSAPAVLAVVDEVSRAASQGRVGVGAVADRGRAAVLVDGEGRRALVSLSQKPVAAPLAASPRAHPSLRAGALLLKGLQGAATARGDLVRLVSAADRLLVLARSVDRTVTLSEWQQAAVDVASCCVALDWTERRDEARALLDEALRPDRVRPGRAASHRGRLLRSDAWFDAAGGPRA